MQGMALSKAYFETYGMPMLRERFSELLPYLAAGLFGSGSECLGYDDEVSQDHDFAPGFCLFLPDEDTVDRQTAFRLERAYHGLPKEFMGFSRTAMQPVGGARHGVFRTGEFFMEKVGTADGVLSPAAWLSVPEQALLEVTGGAVFFDNFGALSRARATLAAFPPDVRRKKLAGQLLIMAQAGQYNYMRCLHHGEEAAAQLAVCEFVKSAMHVVFLLNGQYQPYYKWSFRALRALPLLSLHAELFEYLLTTGNDKEMREEKYKVIEGIAADIIEALIGEKLTKASCGDLEKHAYSVNDGIADGALRNMHILAAV